MITRLIIIVLFVFGMILLYKKTKRDYEKDLKAVEDRAKLMHGLWELKETTWSTEDAIKHQKELEKYSKYGEK